MRIRVRSRNSGHSLAFACIAFFVHAHTVPAQTGMPEQVLGTDSHATQPQPTLPANTAVNDTTAEYLLRSGDIVTVTYRFTPEYDDTATIGPDGHITLKNLGSLPVGGTTLAEVRARVLQAAYTQLRDPEVTVALKQFQQPRFVVGGQVRAPGSFDLRQPTTVLQAILLAGGPMHHSAMGHVLLFRNRTGASPETHVLDLKHLSQNRIADDLLLQPDDMVLVQR